jgi:hypothetical protein
MNRISVVLLLLIASATTHMPAQVYDYRLEESPAISWNDPLFFDARLMALGGISLMASEPFSATLNPALIPCSKKWIVGVSANRLEYESFQYWGVNEGAAVTGSPFYERDLNWAGLTLSRSFNKIRFSAGWTLSNSFDFPDFAIRTDYEYDQYAVFGGLFSGKENTFFAAVAFKLQKTIDFGFKLDYITAVRDMQTLDFSSDWYLISGTYIRKDTQFEHLQNHRSSIWCPTIGLAFQISPRWMVGAALVYPFKGKTERTITRTFENVTDDFMITNTQESTDTLYRPARILIGTRFTMPLKNVSEKEQRLVLALESKYTFWSGYHYIFFDEEIPRELQNTPDLAIGIEYGLINPNGGLFLRLGFRLDPQPLLDPSTTLKVFSGGIGVQAGFVSGDLGISYYYGEAGGIEQNHFLLSSTIGLKF